MEIRIRRRGIVAIAAFLASGAVLCCMNGIGNNVQAIEEQELQSAVTNVQQAAMDVSSEYEVTEWWKADLSEYQENLSLIGYEDVEIEEDEATEAEDETEAEEVSETSETSEDSYVYEGTVTPPQRGEASNSAVAAGSFGFTTYGYGHGVGMSQNGANAYAYYGGWNYQQILQHYYPGTAVVSTGNSDSESLTVNGRSGSAIDIVSQIVYNEMGSTMSPEAMKAQAVAAYTYIKYKGGSAGDLRLKSNPPKNVVNAVSSVIGQAVYYNGTYALTMFGASSGGYTASAKDVFYEDIPYLRSVSSEYDSSYDPNYGSVKAISASEVKSKLESKLGINLSSDPSNWITVIEGDGGFAAYVVIDNQVTVKGNDFRSYLGLKSPKFTCTYN